jgi:hypothetical protein
LWSVIFLSGQNSVNAGVVIFETNRLFGGDSWYYYVGTYKGENGKLAAQFKSTHYAGVLGSPSMGQRPQGTFHFKETGRGHDTNGNRTIDVVGSLAEDPTQSVVARLTWRANLP